jgi:hypothetical protein
LSDKSSPLFDLLCANLLKVAMGDDPCDTETLLPRVANTGEHL